jgi:hypothetical protein
MDGLSLASETVKVQFDDPLIIGIRRKVLLGGGTRSCTFDGLIAGLLAEARSKRSELKSGICRKLPAIYLVDGAYYATSNICSHASALLTDFSVDRAGCGAS